MALGHFISFHAHIWEKVHSELAVGGPTWQAGSEGDSRAEREKERETDREYFFLF